MERVARCWALLLALLLPLLFTTSNAAASTAGFVSTDVASALSTADASQLRAVILNPHDASGMFAGAINQGDPNKPLVALTFDDGPSAYTMAVLNNLSSEGVHATFFDVGTRVVARPDLVQAELVGGNEVENHSYFHNNLGSRTGQYNFPYDTADLKRTARAIMGTGAPRPHFFRPPYGSLQSTLGSASLSIDEVPVTWNVDPRDWSRPGADEIVARVLGATRPGSIILMHDGGGDRSQTVAAVVPIVQGLKARGYTIVRLDELVGAMIGDPCAAPPPHDACPTLEAGPTIQI